MTNALDKRMSYLGLADFDYLSARTLIRSGLGISGLAKAAEAFEKILKLILVLEAKISRNHVLTAKELKAMGHNLHDLLNSLRDRVGATFGKDWDEYFHVLRSAYSNRYPEHWSQFAAKLDVSQLDVAYAFLRGNAVDNFPAEEQFRARQFGTFLADSYTPQVLEAMRRDNAPLPGELLRHGNRSLPEMKIENSTI